jgi:hypothetical protein
MRRESVRDPTRLLRIEAEAVIFYDSAIPDDPFAR